MISTRNYIDIGMISGWLVDCDYTLRRTLRIKFLKQKLLSLLYKHFFELCFLFFVFVKSIDVDRFNSKLLQLRKCLWLRRVN
jgi:hypothetical protein